MKTPILHLTNLIFDSYYDDVDAENLQIKELEKSDNSRMSEAPQNRPRITDDVSGRSDAGRNISQRTCNLAKLNDIFVLGYFLCLQICFIT